MLSSKQLRKTITKRYRTAIQVSPSPWLIGEKRRWKQAIGRLRAEVVRHANIREEMLKYKQEDAVCDTACHASHVWLSSRRRYQRPCRGCETSADTHGDNGRRCQGRLDCKFGHSVFQWTNTFRYAHELTIYFP